MHLIAIIGEHLPLGIDGRRLAITYNDLYTSCNDDKEKELKRRLKDIYTVNVRHL